MFTTGMLITCRCHAVSKLLWELKEHENVISYCSDIDSMHKVCTSNSRPHLLRFSRKMCPHSEKLAPRRLLRLVRKANPI
jgi:hypothetical protein